METSQGITVREIEAARNEFIRLDTLADTYYAQAQIAKEKLAKLRLTENSEAFEKYKGACFVEKKQKETYYYFPQMAYNYNSGTVELVDGKWAKSNAIRIKAEVIVLTDSKIERYPVRYFYAFQGANGKPFKRMKAEKATKLINAHAAKLLTI